VRDGECVRSDVGSLLTPAAQFIRRGFLIGLSYYQAAAVADNQDCDAYYFVMHNAELTVLFRFITFRKVLIRFGLSNVKRVI